MVLGMSSRLSHLHLISASTAMHLDEDCSSSETPLLPPRPIDVTLSDTTACDSKENCGIDSQQYHIDLLHMNNGGRAKRRQGSKYSDEQLGTFGEQLTKQSWFSWPIKSPVNCLQRFKDQSLETKLIPGHSDYTIDLLSSNLTYIHPCRYNGSPNSTPAMHRPALLEARSMQQESDHTLRSARYIQSSSPLHPQSSIAYAIPAVPKRTGPAVTTDTGTLGQ
jgi:hypothetical protein